MTFLMIEAVSTSKTFITFYDSTRSNVTADSRLHTRRLENLKYYQSYCLSWATSSHSRTQNLLYTVYGKTYCLNYDDVHILYTELCGQVVSL
jgi:hypothetical protein